MCISYKQTDDTSKAVHLPASRSHVDSSAPLESKRLPAGAWAASPVFRFSRMAQRYHTPERVVYDTVVVQPKAVALRLFSYLVHYNYRAEGSSLSSLRLFTIGCFIRLVYPYQTLR